MRRGRWSGWLCIGVACGGRTGLENAPPETSAAAPGSSGSAAGVRANEAGSPNGSGGAARGGVGGRGGRAGEGGQIGNRAGQGGNGNTAGSGAVRPRAATSISAGVDMACAVASDGSVWCWGQNDDGQLGDGTTTDSPTVPVRVVGLDDAVAVTTGGTWNSGGRGAARNAFACAVRRPGTVYCWGNVAGIVENAGANRSSLPLAVPGVSNAAALAGGDWHVCALTRQGDVECWGDNAWGQLGDGTSMDCSVGSCPVKVLGLSGATAVTGKGSSFSCAVVADGSVNCWGTAEGGTNFDCCSVPNAASPTVVQGVSTIAGGLDAGYTHTCAIAPDRGSVRCWGYNYDGALGETDDLAWTAAATVGGFGAPVLTVTAGAGNSCVALADGTVSCWGATLAGGSATPERVEGFSDVVAVSAGYNAVCALTKTGSVRCSGLDVPDPTTPLTVIGP
jgi:alpha-tubulin suppressor-like RCC1 family protein